MDAILRALREELRAAESQGLTPPRPTTEASLDYARAQNRLGQLIKELQERWVITPKPFTSRLPVIGGLVVRFRTLWNQVSTRWYVDPVIQQQSDFNGTVLRLAQHVELVLEALQEETRFVWDEATQYDRRRLEATRCLAQLDLLLKAIEERLRQLEEQTERSSLSNLGDRLSRLEGLLALQSPAQPLVRPLAPPDLPSGQAGLPLDSFAFQMRFRGTREQIKARQQPYVEYFRDRAPVVDLGCGRGEFVELLTEAGLTVKGVDSEASMVGFCQQKGLQVEQGDLMEFLAAQEEAGLGGLFAAQVIEHLPPQALLTLFQLGYQKLRPGGVFLVETINPLCLWALASSFTLDLAHQQPVHPETAAFLAESLGFTEVEVRYTSPVPELARLQPLSPLPDPQWEPWRERLNENIERLNGLLFSYQDYALIARKPG